jgi:hypothetical protein
MSIQPQEPDPTAARATAQYIAAMARDLRGLASGSGLPFIAYLLAMVEADASTVGRKATGEEKR